MKNCKIRSKRVRKGSHDLIFPNFAPHQISGMAEGRNLKFCTQNNHRGANEKMQNLVKGVGKGHVTHF